MKWLILLLRAVKTSGHWINCSSQFSETDGLCPDIYSTKLVKRNRQDMPNH